MVVEGKTTRRAEMYKIVQVIGNLMIIGGIILLIVTVIEAVNLLSK
jgi:hypothetical protein